MAGLCLQQLEHLPFRSPDLGDTALQPIDLAAMAQTQIVGHLLLGPPERFTEQLELPWRHAQQFTSVRRTVKPGILLAFSRRFRLEGLQVVRIRRPSSFGSAK